MTERPEDDAFTPEESRALDAWRAKEPPPDFAERVLARASAGACSEPARTTSRMKLAAIAAAVVAVIGIGASLMTAGPDAVSGSLAEAAERTTVTLGARGVAVAEAGASFDWSVASDGTADVTQKIGNVFYRVERGGSFVVHTPRGDVRVVGTCFRVEVEHMKASSAGLLGAGAGVALATTVLVTVYEGKVVTASPQGQIELAAGETARLNPEKGPLKIAVKRGMPGAGGGAGELVVVEKSEEALKPLPEGLNTRELYDAHAKLQKEVQALRVERDALKAKVASGEGHDRAKMLDLSPEELKRMADNCELRWDTQAFRAEPETIGKKQAEELKLSDGEREVIDRALKQNHERVLKELHEIYVEVTGDNTTGALAPMSMFEELNDKAPEGEIQRVFQKLARERAGMEPAPGTPETQSPWERLYRLMTTAGDALEQSVAKELGPELAHQHRAAQGGYGSRSRSSAGCPKAPGTPEEPR